VLYPMPDHKPEPWYWEAGSDKCPHGPEPDDIADPKGWDEYHDRHPGSPQDVRICLDAPMGDHCAACFEESGGDPVPWADCPENPAVPAP